MEKTCPEHGDFRDIIYSDVKLYLKMEEWTFGDNRGLENPAVTDAKDCPDRLRPVQHAHQPHRPGQRRPDQPLQPDLPGLLRQRQRRRLPLRARSGAGPQDAAGAARRAAGGRPHRAVLGRRADHLPALPRSRCGWPRKWASRHIQVATNGIKFTSLEFAQQCKEAGLHTLYLQFDGVCDDVYLRTRGEALLEKKMLAHRERPQGGHEDRASCPPSSRA